MRDQSKNILVTGGCGFIGGNFIRYIKNNFPQHHITCLDKCSYASNLDYIRDYVDMMYVEDICTDISHIFEKKYDYIFHFAAESHVDNSIKDPSKFVKTNVLGTQNLLDNFRKSDYGKFIHISTDEVYGHLGFNDDPFTESTPIAPRSPYAASKASSDLLCLSYINTYNCNISITRCCNNYGPNQHNEKFIPTIIKSLSKNQKVPIYGDGMNIREWIHVDDHNSAVWLVATQGKPEVYNIGSGNEQTNIELVDSICSIMGKDLDKSAVFIEDRLGHDFRYSINSNKIKNDLLFKPQYNNFEDQLKELVKIYSES